MIHRPQQGMALIVVLIALSLAASYFFLRAARASGDKISRDKVTAAALAQAKEALLGFAVAYRDTHPDLILGDPVLGYLPCPDTDNDGRAELSCGSAEVSAIGRLPWNTLGLPPLRDGAGECLWYALSGHGKNSPKTAAMNWDTTGQFAVQNADGIALTGPGNHDRAMAVIFSPQHPLGNQTRPSSGANECGGSIDPTAYLEDAAINGAPDGLSALKLATPASAGNGTNNDQGTWITPKEIFQRIKRRSSFWTDIDALMADLKTCLDGRLPLSTGSKGMGKVTEYCRPADLNRRNVFDDWKDNLLYAKPVGSLTVNGKSCDAILIFGGERIGAQNRSTAAERDNAANYLEGTIAALFPNAGAYTGPEKSDPAIPNADLVKCIAMPQTTVSFTNNFGSFVPAGRGVTIDTARQVVTLGGASGTQGGCFWYPAPLPLAGKTVRFYYEFRFTDADPYAATGSGSDNGNGFTFQMVRSNLGSPASVCGAESDMGALALGNAGDSWGNHSLTIETDVRQDSTNSDPAANHTAIMANGNLDHSSTNGNVTSACNGAAAGCAHSPANAFEESPTPLLHRQRMEMVTGCNSGCVSCDPAAHTAPNTHARVRVWVDCAGCSDVTTSFGDTPTVQRCLNLAAPDSDLNNAYFGFTGGFRSGSTTQQGVQLMNFVIRSE